MSATRGRPQKIKAGAYKKFGSTLRDEPPRETRVTSIRAADNPRLTAAL
ncbi:hypothetical protein [Nocardia pseudobrasiliensis]|nr:hypothetical protein [Nocardia pseudobrasiliensis]